MRQSSTPLAQAQKQLQQQQRLQQNQAAQGKEGSNVGIPVISKAFNSSIKAAVGQPRKQVGLMGSIPGSVQQISSSEVRKLRQEIQNLRDTNEDLKDALHEARQEFLLARQEKDSYKTQVQKFKAEIASFDSVIKFRIAKAIEANNVELREKVQMQAAEIEKLKSHNQCFKETIDFLESQLKTRTEDLNKASITLMQSYNRSKGVQLESMMIRKSEQNPAQRQSSDEDSLDRDETELNQQESEPSPVGLNVFQGKRKSTNLVTPYCPDPAFDDNAKQVKSKIANASRYKSNEVDFSRDISGLEDIGIGEDTDNVLFDDQDLFGDKADMKTLAKNNRFKMNLDELAVNDLEQSYRQQTNLDDETGGLNSDRAMVPLKRSPKKRGNPLTKSLGVPNSSTKDGSGDKSGRSGGILGLSGINLDFRKSKDGLKSLFQKSINGAAGSSSIQFTQLEKH